MFSFIKKAVDSGNTVSAEDKERRKQDKKDRKDKQKRDRANMSAEELLRLDEVRRSLKITGKRRKDKEKLPSGITADYTADFLASLDRIDDVRGSGSSGVTVQRIGNNGSGAGSGAYTTQSDSSETSLNSLGNITGDARTAISPPTIPPKPPKRGILKTARQLSSGSGNGANMADSNGAIPAVGGVQLTNNTLLNEVITYENVPPMMGGGGLLGVMGATAATSPSADSLTDTSNSTASFTTPPFSLSPVGGVSDSQSHYHWSDGWSARPLLPSPSLPLPPIRPLQLPPARTLTLYRNPAKGDFGFSLRRAMVLLRDGAGVAGNDDGSRAGGDNGNTVTMRAVIFAEPSAGSVANSCSLLSNETGLLPGDKLLEVNGVQVEGKSREEIIEMIKASGESVILKVQPVAELSELTRRHGHDGQEIVLDEANIKSGTLRRSGSRRFNNDTKGKTEEELTKEQLWLDTEKLWLVHRSGFTLARRLPEDKPTNNGAAGLNSTGKLLIQVEDTQEALTVDGDDVEPANPPQFDRVEDLTSLRHLNESSVLHTLRQRYASNLIHTYAGPNTLLVVNPVAPLAVYSEKVISLFRGCKPEDTPPHVYSAAQAAHHALRATRRDQSILLLGPSGAGKTANFRHCVQYLATACKPPGSIGGRQQTALLTPEKLTAVWLVLESFGNCRTGLNQNASRFTQLFTLDFDSNGFICSASLQVLLFERTRILKPSTFHIVDKLLYGADGALRRELSLDQLLLTTPIPDPAACPAAAAAASADERRCRAQAEFGRVTAALQVLGASAAEQRLVWVMLGAVVMLKAAGCVRAGSTTTTTTTITSISPTAPPSASTLNTRCQFQQAQLAQRAAYLLGVSSDDLGRQVFGGAAAGGGELGEAGDGQEALDAAVVGLYVEVFNCVTAIINR